MRLAGWPCAMPKLYQRFFELDEPNTRAVGIRLRVSCVNFSLLGGTAFIRVAVLLAGVCTDPPLGARYAGGQLRH